MKYDAEIHHRRSIRLKEYYSQAGAYFATICTHERKFLFGDIFEGQMILNGFGKIAKTEWLRTAEIRKNIFIDEFIIMPNHLHGNIFICDPHDVRAQAVGAHCNVPLHSAQTERFGKSTHNSIPTIVKLFKSTVTKQINELRNTPGQPVWQLNYFERVIRDEDELNRIREYIRYNPLKWDEDRDNPENWDNV